jgi:hypothetical protein
MRYLGVLAIASAVAVAGCGGGMMTSPAKPTPAATITGTWVGSASDSSGTMMGSGTSMGGATWSLSQTGSTFSGTMSMGGRTTGTMSGTLTGHTGTYTMTMSPGSMMTAGCSATATGTFDMDDMMTEFRGTYSGTNSCTGAFDHGDLAMHR